MRNLYVFLVVILFFACTAKKSTHYDLLIANGNVIDLETGNSTKKNIFISDGRIKKITPVASSFSFKASKTIDATDKYIVPGFWDNHVHFRGGDTLIEANKNFLKLFIANGITTVRDAGGDLTTAVLDWRKQISSGTLTGPTIFTSGPKIDGNQATWAGSLEVTDEASIQKALDSLERIPVDFAKIYDSKISGDVYLKTIAEAEKRGLITSGHMPFTVELNQVVDTGIDAIEHLYYIMKGCAANEKEVTQQMKEKVIGFWDAMPLLMTHYNDTIAQKTFSNLKKKQVFVVPTLHIGQVLSKLDETDHTHDSYLKYMGNGIVKTYEGRINRMKNSSAQAIANGKAVEQFFGTLTKTLNEAGVNLLAGSDSGAYNSYTYPGISLHKELEQMVISGISPLEALKTSAYNGAKFLKQDADYGLVAEGKIADLVVLDANPLENITNTQKIHAVIQKNDVHTATELASLLQNAIQH